MNNCKLHTIKDWERAQPEGTTYSRVFFTQSGEVRKVKGTITILKKRIMNGESVRVPGYRKVYWDGFGRCYVGTHSIRKRDHDIPLKTE